MIWFVTLEIQHGGQLPNEAPREHTQSFYFEDKTKALKFYSLLNEAAGYHFDKFVISEPEKAEIKSITWWDKGKHCDSKIFANIP